MSDCLLLNADHNPISVLPLSIIGWQHAVKLMFLERVVVLEEYDDWIIRSARSAIHVPAVAVTKEYFNIKKMVKFSRSNLFLRDLYQCQYCGDTFSSSQLTLDHVIPRTMGGKTNWMNAVTACKPCNSKKSDKLMKPLHAPYKPDYYKLVKAWENVPFHVKHPSWNQYLKRNG